jgi:hypothetical protein
MSFLRIVSLVAASVGSVLAEGRTVTITRLDATSALDPNNLNPTSFKVNVDPLRPFTADLTAGAAVTPFLIDFQCDQSPEICARALNGYKAASDRIARVLKIRTPIRIKAVYRSFCDVPATQCSESNTLGQAASASYFSARRSESDPWTLYPQALVKQLNKKTMLNYAAFDVFAEFNADSNFWFPNDTTPIAPNQYDFEFVVAHEITHGLGFNTRFTAWDSLISGLSASDAKWLVIYPLPFNNLTHMPDALCECESREPERAALGSLVAADFGV